MRQSRRLGVVVLLVFIGLALPSSLLAKTNSGLTADGESLFLVFFQNEHLYAQDLTNGEVTQLDMPEERIEASLPADLLNVYHLARSPLSAWADPTYGFLQGVWSADKTQFAFIEMQGGGSGYRLKLFKDGQVSLLVEGIASPEQGFLVPLAWDSSGNLLLIERFHFEMLQSLRVWELDPESRQLGLRSEQAIPFLSGRSFVTPDGHNVFIGASLEDAAGYFLDTSSLALEAFPVSLAQAESDSDPLPTEDHSGLNTIGLLTSEQLSKFIEAANSAMPDAVFPAAQRPSPFIYWPMADNHRDISYYLDSNWTSAMGRTAYPGHMGTDVELAMGTQLYAAAAGTVSLIYNECPDHTTNFPDLGAVPANCPIGPYPTGNGFGYNNEGNVLMIRHTVIVAGQAQNWYTNYGHLKKDSMVVSVGTPVGMGDPIALSGHSGKSEGPHLHFEVRHIGYNYADNDDPWGDRDAPHTEPDNSTLWIYAGTEVVSALDIGLDWRFDTSTHGWTPNGAMSFVGHNQGWAVYDVTSSDPSITSPTLAGFSASAYPYLHIEALSTVDACGQVYFRRSTDAAFDGSRVVEFVPAPSGNREYYAIDMTSNPQYTGTIVQLRIDLACEPNEAPNQIMLHHIWLGQAPTNPDWNFNSDTQGWSANNSMTYTGQSSSNAVYDITGDDPILYSPNTVGFPAHSHPYLYLVFASTVDACGQVYFRRSTDDHFSETRAVHFTPLPNGNREFYALNMRANPNYNGMIVQLRVDLACSPNGAPDTIQLRRIRFGPTAPGLPTLLQPQSGVKSTHPFNIILESGMLNYTGQADWWVQIDNDADFSSPVFDNVAANGSLSTSPTIAVPALPQGSYYVRAMQGDRVINYSGWTAGMPFQVDVFTDVPTPTKEWMEPWIEQFYNAGLSTGCGLDPAGNRRYCPENPTTRAEMAVFLIRALHYGSLPYTPTDPDDSFDDVPVIGKEWMQSWIEEFYDLGITTGCAANPLQYCPEREVTRAEMAVFVLRALEGSSYVPPAASHFFADVPEVGKEWMEAWIDEFKRRNITGGCGYNESSELIFCPEREVTRAEMAVFIIRAFESIPNP